MRINIKNLDIYSHFLSLNHLKKLFLNLNKKVYHVNPNSVKQPVTAY